MSKTQEKITAQNLRRKGLSIKDIAKKLCVSRSSASVWCADIELTSKQRERLFAKQIASGNAGRQKGAEVNRAKRLSSLEEANKFASKYINELSSNDLFFLGLGLYWGEGIKSRSGPASIVNSDPKVLKVSILWFCKCLKVELADIRPYVYIAKQHQSREDIIMNYWAKQLLIPKTQFKSPIYISQKPMQKYENHDSYYGVVSLRVRRSSFLKYKILALINESSNRLELS